MTTGHSRRVLRAAVLMGTFAALVAGLLAPAAPRAVARPQDEKKDDKKYPKPPEPPGFSNTFSCGACHSIDEATAKVTYKQTAGNEFVRLGENRTWSVYDLHSQARENLDPKKNKTAEVMETNLKKYNGDKYSNATDVNCLACHGSVMTPINTESPRKEREESLYPNQWKVESFAPGEGVGCEMCHGHGSAYSSRHTKAVANPKAGAGGPNLIVPWREWDPKVKHEWGLVDLRDSSELVKRCASCHVGNVAEGRFVTHEMFAAGHPPLPPFDAMAYMREQPRHWGLPRQMEYLKALTVADPETAWKVFHIRKESEELNVTRRFAVTAIATLRESAQVLAQQAQESAKHGDGMDFATFDCYACHHDLKYPSDRQTRGYVGRPGRVLLRQSALVLARAVAEHAGGMKDSKLAGAEKALDEANAELAKAFQKKALGEVDKVVPAVDKVVKWCNDTIAKMDGVRYDRAETVKLARALIHSATDKLADPEAAQVLAWGVETLRFELRDTASKVDEEHKKDQAAIEAQLGKLDGFVVRRLRVNLPFLPSEPDLPPDPKTDPAAAQKLMDAVLKPVSARVGQRQTALNAFKADGFRDVFTNLDPLLSKLK
jgi:hypothetical protein